MTNVIKSDVCDTKERVKNEAVEILASWHCNIRCRWCALASPTSSTRFARPEVVASDLTSLSRWLQVDHVRILGGEPLMNPDLVAILAAIRSSHIAPKIRIVTNGLLLNTMLPEIWENVDQIHISMYPNTAPGIEKRLEALHAIARDTKTELIVKRFDSFRVSFRVADSDHALTQRIYSTCQIANVWRSITADNGRLYRCPQSAHIQTATEYGAQKSAHNDDYLEIGRIQSCDELERWLGKRSHLRSCEVCAGSVGRMSPHQQIIRQEPKEHLDIIDREYLKTLEGSILVDNGCVSEIRKYGEGAVAAGEVV